MRLAAAALALLFAAPASAQTVRDIAARGRCSTSGVERLSQQLAEEQRCLRPGGFVRFAPHPNITLSSSRVHPYAQASAAAAIRAAADRQPIQVNSAFRTLADQYVLYHSGGCGLAARPGRSNHQSGRAIDVQNHGAARGPLTGAGCAWFGSSDAVHFDCPGSDLRSDSVAAFQRLWNRNHPSDRIAVDGIYGPQTDARVARAPAGGFATSGCEPMSCAAACDGDGFVDAMCARTACGAGEVCREDGGAPRCAAPAMDEGALLGAVFVRRADPDDTSVRIPRAEVRVLAGPTGLEGPVSADETGVFRLDLAPGRYELEASAEGYAPARRACEVTGSEPVWCSIGLDSAALTTGTLRGVVYDADRGLAERVVHARVQLGDAAPLAVDPTDASFSFEVAPGEHVVEVTGEDLQPASASCLVMPGDSTWCSVGVRARGDAALETVRVDEPVPDDGRGMPDVDDVPVPDVATGPGRDSASGCAAIPGAPSAPWWLALGLALALRRRRGSSATCSPSRA